MDTKIVGSTSISWGSSDTAQMHSTAGTVGTAQLAQHSCSSDTAGSISTVGTAQLAQHSWHSTVGTAVAQLAQSAPTYLGMPLSDSVLTSIKKMNACDDVKIFLKVQEGEFLHNVKPAETISYREKRRRLNPEEVH